MPLITSCPECNTQFVVTEEQLDAHKGKVRCGTCNHVFNATDYFVESDKNTPNKPSKSASSNVKNQLKNLSLDEDTDTSKAVVEVAPQVVGTNVAPEVETSTDQHIEIESPSQYKHQPIEETVKTSPDNTESDQSDSPTPVKDLTLDERLNSLSKKKPFNWLLALLCLLLLLALIGQLLYSLRTEVASQFPQTKPLYAKACEKIGCTVELPKKLEFLTIDDSDMQEHLKRENVLQFSSTLINHSRYAQAYPMIELTLTNTDDEPVLRRTLNPKQYLSSKVNVAKGIASKQEIRIKLNVTTDDVAVAGYRVSLAY